MVSEYIDHRRAKVPREVCDLPVLNVLYGERRSHGKAQHSLENMLCFERDWSFTRDEKAVIPTSQLKRTASGQPGDGLASKKRQVKHGKAFAVEDMLRQF